MRIYILLFSRKLGMLALWMNLSGEVLFANEAKLESKAQQFAFNIKPEKWVKLQ